MYLIYLIKKKSIHPRRDFGHLTKGINNVHTIIRYDAPR